MPTKSEANITISKSWQGFIIVIIRRTYCGDHDRFAIATESVHEYFGESRVTIGHYLSLAVRGLRGQRCDAIAQRGEWQIDGYAFLEAFACGARLAGSFAARQIDQIENRLTLHHAALVVLERLFEHEFDDGVRAATRRVHFRLGYGLVGVALLDQLLNALIVQNLHGLQILFQNFLSSLNMRITFLMI